VECLWQLLVERSALVPPAVFCRCSDSLLVKSSSLSYLTKFRKCGKQQWVVIRTWFFFSSCVKKSRSLFLALVLARACERGKEGSAKRKGNTRWGPSCWRAMRGLWPFSSTTEMGTSCSLVLRIILPLCGTRTTESAWVLTVAITELSGAAMFPVCWTLNFFFFRFQCFLFHLPVVCFCLRVSEQIKP
jgi:hypothetical protein